jgi:NhaP-type Na+/H+ or K+/H+ antiporter
MSVIAVAVNVHWFGCRIHYNNVMSFIALLVIITTCILTGLYSPRIIEPIVYVSYYRNEYKYVKFKESLMNIMSDDKHGDDARLSQSY